MIENINSQLAREIAYKQYGAHMGRYQDLPEHGEVTKLYLQQVTIDRGGYDRGGAYWGLGPRLYCAHGYTAAGDQVRIYARGKDRDHAKQNLRDCFDNITFYK